MPAPKTPDYFAELYVAGRFAEAGWNVYFPHRDQGFDFVVSKVVSGNMVLRPVQVKGKYPWEEKGDKSIFGYVGKLTALHPQMVLAIPFFSPKSNDKPVCTAYLPRPLLKKHPRGFRCQPAIFRGGEPKARRDYAKFFGQDGLTLIESPGWDTLGGELE